jgi:hypothetical protein
MNELLILQFRKFFLCSESERYNGFLSLKDLIPKMLTLFWEKNYEAGFGYCGRCSEAHSVLRS